MSRSKDWCYTLNNYTIAQSVTLDDIDAVYHVWGYERAASGTPHIQGFIQMEKRMRLGGMKTLFPTAHLEIRKGTPEEACDYCKKDGDYVEKGELQNQGQRNDLKHATANEEATAHKRSIRNASHYKKRSAQKFYDQETTKRSRLTAANGEATTHISNQLHTTSSTGNLQLPSDTGNITSLPSDIQMKKIIENAKMILNKTMTQCEKMNVENDTNADVNEEKIRPNICIFCDKFIIGTSKVNWISKEIIIKHSHRINIDRWLQISGFHEINHILREQYKFDEPGFETLLLSPRSMKNENNYFMCCSTCYGSFTHDKLGSAPPKYSFANNNLIGFLPDEAWKSPTDTSEMNFLLPLMIAPIRPFYYLFSFHGGACKRIKGTVSFFSNSQLQMHGGLEAIRNRLNNLVFFLVFLGRFTQEQKLVTRNRVKVNMEQYSRLLQWMITNNREHFNGIDINNPSVPIIIDKNDDASENLHDDSVDRETESQFDVKFYYPSNDTPTESTAGFGTNDAFLRAVISGNTPTMYLFGNNFVSDINLSLEKVFPIAFPFGIGGPGVHRENKMSYEECLRHYRDLCIPAMHKDDIILVSNHLLNRILSFKYAIIRCNKKVNPQLSLAEQFSNISVTELESACERRRAYSLEAESTTGSQFLQSVEACCRPIQHTAEAASVARGKYYAIHDRFGFGALFVTVSPTANRNLRVKVFATGKPTTIPEPWDMNEEECTHFLEHMIDLNQMYPGAGELEFRSQLDIFIEHLLMWDRKKHVSKGISIFGVVTAFGITVEDQLNGTLHGHMIIMIEGTLFRCIIVCWS